MVHNAEVVIVGDFNIHLDELHDNNAKQFQKLLLSYGLQQHVSQPTHKHGHWLDLIITWDNAHLVSNISFHPGLSDHCAITCLLSMQKPQPQLVSIKTRRLKSFNIDAFRGDLAAKLSDRETAALDANTCVQNYELIVGSLFDQHAPEQTRTVRIRPNSPWFTEEIRLARHKRRQLERKWRQSRTEINRQIYQEQRLFLNKLISRAKVDYYSSCVTQCNGDQKKLFKVVNSLLHKNKKPVLPTCVSVNILVEDFSAFFHQKIATIRSEFNKSSGDKSTSNVHSDGSVKHIAEFDPTSVAEMINVVSNSPVKSCALDPVPTYVVKGCIHVLAPFLVEIANKSFEQGVFPDSLKLACIRPLLKRADLNAEALNSYRPIANLKFVGKIIERIVASRLLDVINDQCLSDKFQSAYKSHHSVESALLRVQNDILRAMDDGRVTALVLLDLSAAFDTVDHLILLRRLRDIIGVYGKALKWCQSYLQSRPQFVQIGSSKSQLVVHDFGVPQGSVLGPLWFTVYTYPLQDIISRHQLNYHLYADDTQLYLSFRPLQDSADQEIENMETCVSEIRAWMRDNFLKLNDEKTEFMLFGSSSQLAKISVPHITIGDTDVSVASKARDLGVIFDSTMSLDSHVSSVVRCTSFHIHTIGKIRKYLTSKAAEQIVHSVITSRLDMGNALLFGLPQSQIDRLQRIQNSAARIVTLSRKACHITPVLRELHWLPVKFRIIYKMLLFVYKSIHGLAPAYIDDLLQPYNPTRSLRSSSMNLFREPRSSHSWGDRSFSCAAPRLWNKLPARLQSSPSLPQFKEHLKTHLFNQAFID